MLNDEAEQFQGLLQEVYSANDEGLNRLVLMGLRALLDQIMITEVGEQGSFEKKLQALLQKGIISSPQMGQLRSVLEAGHAAIHRGFEPEDRQVERAFEIIERVLSSMFSHESDIRVLSDGLPPDTRRRSNPS